MYLFDFPPYFTVIVMQSIALAGFLLAGSYAVAVNCLVKNPFHKRILEITAFFSSKYKKKTLRSTVVYIYIYIYI